MFKTLFIVLCVAASASSHAQEFNGTWIHQDPENHSGFRVFEKDYLTIQGDQATWSQSMGEHSAFKSTRFYFKGPDICQFNETDWFCQVSETRLRLCATTWNCDEYIRTTEKAPNAPAKILDRADGRFVLQFVYRGTKYAREITSERLFPETTNYPILPVRVTLYTDPIQMVEARLTTYWVSGKSSDLTSYATLMELFSISLIDSSKDRKIGTMKSVQKLGHNEHFGFDDDLDGYPYQLEFFSLL